MRTKNIDIDFNSFIKKGVKKVYEPFGCFFVTGYMGSGKTYFAVKFANDFKSDYKIKTNIKSLNIPNANIEHFTKLEEIWKDTEEYVLYIIDELATRFPKESKQDNNFYEFLQHSRKTKRIVIMIHQEYLLIPPWLRSTCKEVFTTSKIKFLPLFCTYRGNAYLDDESKTWLVDYNFRYIYKRTKDISSYYDTFETVSAL